MPSYDYRCADCDEVFEEFQRITAPAGATCPACNSTQCTRLISGGTFHLKGGGWYASDYGGSGRSGTAATQQANNQAETPPAEAEAAPSEACGGCAGPAADGSCAADDA